MDRYAPAERVTENYYRSIRCPWPMGVEHAGDQGGVFGRSPRLGRWWRGAETRQVYGDGVAHPGDGGGADDAGEVIVGTPPAMEGEDPWWTGPPHIAEEVAACKRPQHRRARLMPVTTSPADVGGPFSLFPIFRTL
jgi:hypothetical protein